jgi:BASS family bile acid:Na+ symporter
MTIEQLINPVAAITLFEMMVAIGLGARFAEVAGVARDRGLVARAALANYVCVPAIAVLLLVLFRADPLVAAGFLIAAVCPGAPYGPPFTAMAGGNRAISVGLMVILAGSSAVLAPLLLYLLLPLLQSVLPAAASGGQEVEIPATKVATTLLLAQLLPLCLGLAVRHRRPALAERLGKPANRLSLVLNLLTLGLILYAQRDTLLNVPLRAYGGMLVLVVAAVLIGWLLGTRGSANRTAMAMATAVRNVGLGLVIATGSFAAGSKPVTATTVFALFQTILMALIALSWVRLASAGGGGGRAQEPAGEKAIGGGGEPGAAVRPGGC